MAQQKIHALKFLWSSKLLSVTDNRIFEYYIRQYISSQIHWIYTTFREFLYTLLFYCLSIYWKFLLLLIIKIIIIISLSFCVVLFLWLANWPMHHHVNKKELNWITELRIFEPWYIELATKVDARNVLSINYIIFIMYVSSIRVIFRLISPFFKKTDPGLE